MSTNAVAIFVKRYSPRFKNSRERKDSCRATLVHFRVQDRKDGRGGESRGGRAPAGGESLSHRDSRSLVRSFFPSRRPPETCSDRRRVVFALDHELGLALVEAEHFVGQIQAIHNEIQSVRETNATLSVNL